VEREGEEGRRGEGRKGRVGWLRLNRAAGCLMPALQTQYFA